MTLTADGEALLPFIRRVLADVEATSAEARALSGMSRGRLSIGATPSLITRVLAPALVEFHASHPGIELLVVEAGSRQLVRQLASGEVDLALVVLPINDPLVATTALFDDPLVLAVAPDHPLATPAGRSVAVTELDGLPLVMFREGYDLREVTLAACRNAGVEPRLVSQGGEMDGVLAFVAAGLGAAVVPAIAMPAESKLTRHPLQSPGIEPHGGPGPPGGPTGAPTGTSPRGPAGCARPTPRAQVAPLPERGADPAPANGDGRRRQRSHYTPRMDGPAHTDPSSTPGPGTLRPPADLARTLGDLRASGWKSVPVAEEMRRNTMARIAAGESLVPGVLGFDDTVIPQLENAILAGHDIILLGERGQAKTRVIRALVGLLDEWLPIVEGSEINDDPYAPVSRGAINAVNDLGDDTPIAWVHRSQRYGEKLATPDTSIADLIGEVDPIKIAEGRYLSDELALHYGLIPRVNRGIFAINELPDLSERIQVGLLNVLEERDVQIRGHRIRLPLDITLVATANPEDYTNRGRIITPLKDRFGAQIRTHYPYDTMTEVKIMESEAELPTAGIPVTVPLYLEGGRG